MGLNLGVMGGAAGDSLEDILKQKFLEQIQKGHLAIAKQQADDNSEYRRMAQDTARQTAADRSASAAEALGQATASNLKRGDSLDESQMAALAKAPGTRGTFERNPANPPSLNVTGPISTDAGGALQAAPVRLASGGAQAPTTPGTPAGGHYIGTAAQREGDERDAALSRIIGDPNHIAMLQATPEKERGAVISALIKAQIEGPTAGRQTQRFLDLRQKELAGQPLTPQEQAEKQAYVDNKSIGPEAASASAMDRQSRTIAAQVAQQGRAQSFTENQAGRSELTSKVEQPYLDAREKAATLRSTLEAAKNGNMAAASVTPLLATLGLVTSEGVKRINTTELEQVQGAGSLLERLRGQLGGLKDGQPLSPKIQEDLGNLASLLEQSAAKKYLAGHRAVTTRYGLRDEQPLSTAIATANGTSTAPAGGGFQVVGVRDK